MEITITRKNGQTFTVLFDPADEAIIRARKWHLSTSKNYTNVMGRVNRKHIVLARLLLQARPDQFVDHINGNTLDNRRSNLRFATSSENLHNIGCRKTKGRTSKYLGVSWDSRAYWVSKVTVLGKNYLGWHHSELDAAKHRDQMAIKYQGRFARLNFPITPSLL